MSGGPSLLYSKVRDGENKANLRLPHMSGACWEQFRLRCCHQPFTWGTSSVGYSLAAGITQHLPVTCQEGLSIAAIFLGSWGHSLGVDISVACVHPIPVFLAVPTPPNPSCAGSLTQRPEFYNLQRMSLQIYVLCQIGEEQPLSFTEQVPGLGNLVIS